MARSNPTTKIPQKRTIIIPKSRRDQPEILHDFRKDLPKGSEEKKK